MFIARRELLRLGAATACALIGSSVLGATPGLRRRSLGGVGPLGDPDANGLRLPRGFTSRIVARSGHSPVSGKPYRWHPAPDGGATFATPDGGWIYVSNSEMSNDAGGVGALRFSRSGEVLDAYPILANTNVNCAGGPTPWGTWLSCEEYPDGRVWECDPHGRQTAQPYAALGVFTHEAVAVDPKGMQLYLTEDVPDGRWYRFTPAQTNKGRRPGLDAGTLEVAEVLGGEEGQVRWHRIADPQGGSKKPTRAQVANSSVFKGGEGCWYGNGCIYFTTKRDNRVWMYDIAREHISIIYDAARHPKPELTGVDNVTISPGSDVLVAEDGGDLQIIAITPERNIVPIMQIVGHDQSEVTGPAFDPSGTRLYFSSQRGATGRSEDGVTFEVTGPFGG